MPRVYKIHPAIGIMRVGDSDAFFVGPEKLDHPGVEINADGSETQLQQYKSLGKVKRQAARFRVWEYEREPNGSLTRIGEVLAPAQIEWTVSLVNSKAAGNQLASVDDGHRRVLLPTGSLRNATISNRESLIIRGGSNVLSGPNQGPVKCDLGSFLGQSVDLGEALTDREGRLIVVGGHGKARGIPLTPGGPVPPLSHFANNDRWHDDVSDGPVTARVTVAGQAPIDAIPSWVICAPPDFAPGSLSPATLYDIALQAAILRGWTSEPAMPSFTADILPILARSLSLRWVHDWVHWDLITDNWPALADANNHAARLLAFNEITQTSLHEYGLPDFMMSILTKWRDGHFLSDLNVAPPPLAVPDACDRSALETCIATSFFPGIEAGFVIANPNLYLEFCRLSHQQVVAGQLSGQMALPWQADFNDCASDWWPSQRPNDIFTSAANVPNSPSSWADGVYTGDTSASRKKMVTDFSKLGFIVRDHTGNVLESERDTSLPPR